MHVQHAVGPRSQQAVGVHFGFLPDTGLRGAGRT